MAEKNYKKVLWQTTNESWIDPDNLKVIQFEPTSFCNLRCPRCSRTDDTTLLPTAHIVRFQQHIDLSLIDSMIKDLPNLERVKMDGDIGDAMMHPKIYEICKIIKKRSPNTLVQINTNGCAGKDITFRKILELGSVFFVLGIDGLEDTNHIHRTGANWKIIKRRLEMIRDIAPWKHKWRWLDFDYNKHQKDVAKEMAFDHKINMFEVAPAYSDSNDFINEVIEDKKSGRRNQKGQMLKKDGTPIVKEYYDFDTDEPYNKDSQFRAEKEYLDGQINAYKDEWHVCPWQQQEMIQVMSTGQVWPCCWSSEMQIFATRYGYEKLAGSSFVANTSKDLQYKMSDWFRKLGPNWVEDITLREDYSLRDVLESKSYSKLAVLLKKKKGNYNLSFCSISCGSFTETEKRIGGFLTNKVTGYKKKRQLRA